MSTYDVLDLARVLADIDAVSVDGLVVAVSGGVDSLTLAAAAHFALGPRVAMVHASSPAVPSGATARTVALAAQRGWDLTVIDAGELDDPNYVANPVDRCFYCKTDLYRSIARHDASLGVARTIVSGANTDDLGDYRPGLRAAAEHGVRHPFVEAGIGKAGIRALAALLGLGDIAELPASPCLSSRVETGITIRPRTLAFIDRAEVLVRERLHDRQGNARCRVRAGAVVIELDATTLAGLNEPARQELSDAVLALAASAGLDAPVMLEPYRQGSAFLREQA